MRESLSKSVTRLEQLRIVVVASLAVYLITFIPYALIGMKFYHHVLCPDPKHTMEQFVAVSVLIIPFAALNSLSFIVAGIAWMFWSHRAYSNLSEHFGVQTRSSATLAALGYLIPLAHLVIPYRHLSEIWDHTAHVDEKSDKRNLYCYWGTWVLMLLMGNLFISGSVAPRGVDSVMVGVSVGTTVSATLAAGYVISKLTAYQRMLFEAHTTNPDDETSSGPDTPPLPSLDYYGAQ